jgi:hypothetical protein
VELALVPYQVGSFKVNTLGVELLLVGNRLEVVDRILGEVAFKVRSLEHLGHQMVGNIEVHLLVVVRSILVVVLLGVGSLTFFRSLLKINYTLSFK